MLAQKHNKIMYKNMFSNFCLFPIGHLTHPLTSSLFLFFLFTWPLNLSCARSSRSIGRRVVSICHGHWRSGGLHASCHPSLPGLLGMYSMSSSASPLGQNPLGQNPLPLWQRWTKPPIFYFFIPEDCVICKHPFKLQGEMFALYCPINNY